MMKAYFVVGVLLFLGLSAFSQTTSIFEQRLYDSYIEERVKDWDDIIFDMELSYKQSKDAELLYSLVFAQYGYIGYCISEDMEREAKNSLEEAMENAKDLEKLTKGRHDVLALRGALYGYKIILSKFSSLYYAPKAYKLISTAAKSSDIYFNCSLEMGNIKYYTPKFLGGSKEEALQYYQKAVKVIDSDGSDDIGSWRYINTLLFLARAYLDTGSPSLASEVYERILVYEPEIEWVREEYKEKCKK